jgi:dTDP-4-dehydrorhamnose reductase
MRTAKAIVLGGAGMLGHKMFQVLRERFAGVLCTVRASPLARVELLAGNDVIPNIDALDFPLLDSTLRAHRPELVINCIGLIKQRAQASCPTPSIVINSLLPHHLGEMASEWGGQVIHFSTDCVFSGRHGAYCEEDRSDAEDLYGKTKFLGEVSSSNALTLRTSIIGRELSEHRSLLEWFLAKAPGKVRGFRKAIYSGVTTNHLAETVADIIERKPGLSGLYQLASARISKFDLLHILKSAYRLSIEIEPDDSEVCDRSMRGDRFVRATGLVCPAWPELLRRMAVDPTPYSAWLGKASSQSSLVETAVSRGN